MWKPRVVLLALAVSGLTAGSAIGQVCSAGAFGSTSQDPLVITGNWNVGDGCWLDFGPRHVILDGTLNVEDVTISCAKLTINGSGRIDGTGGGWTDIEVFAQNGWDGTATINGKIRQNDSFGGGDIDIYADGDILIFESGAIEARGVNSADADGGYIYLDAIGDVIADGASPSINVNSGGDATGGDITIDSDYGDVEIRRNVDASGGDYDGGYIDVIAWSGNVLVDGRLDANATKEGWGGVVTLDADLDLNVTGIIDADGGGGTAYYGGGDGGFVDFFAGRDINLSSNVQLSGGYLAEGGAFYASAGGDFLQSAGTIDARCTVLDGSGGAITIDSAGTLTLDGSHNVDGDGDYGSGGTILWTAGGDIILNGDVTADGGFGGTFTMTSSGGSIRHTGGIEAGGKGSGGSGGSITLGSYDEIDLSNGRLDADGFSSSGQGGTILVTAGFDLLGDVNTRISARGNGSNGGTGGVVQLAGCRVDLPIGSDVWARGNQAGGSITITSGDVMTLGGDVDADGNSIVLNTRLGSPWSPITTGASFDPSPTIVVQPSAPPCLAYDTLTLAATPQISIGQGQQAAISIQSTPNRGVVLFADWTPVYNNIGVYGYQQVDPGTAFRLADFGYFGPPIAGSMTDGGGNWNYLSNPLTNPTFVGRTIWLEAYVEDQSARNGFFHQSPLVPIEFIP